MAGNGCVNKAVDTLDEVSRPLDSFRKVPGVGVLAERQMGGFLAIAALVGVGVGVGAAALVTIVEWLQLFLLPTAIDEGRAWIFLTVPAGFLIARMLATRLAPEVAGDGVPEAVAALEIQGGHMRARTIPLKILATAVTIGGGGSAGREGPIVQIGAAIGSVISRRFKLGEDQIRSLVAAGAGAGIGATFNAPIAGMLFALEVILSSFAARHMSAIVIASVTAAVTTQSLVGDKLAIRAGTYELGDPRELLLYAGLAILVVAVGILFIRLLGLLQRLVRRDGASWGLTRPVIAGLLVAGLVFVEPGVFGTGQAVVNRLLSGDVSGVWWVLMLLGLAKVGATALTLSSGASGGAFMPSLVTGAAMGTGFALLIAPAWNVSVLNSGAFAIVGMAGMFAVVGRAPLTAVLLVFEVTGARDYKLILPLMLTATLATFLAERFHPDSVYSLGLKMMGVSVRRTGEVDVLDTIDVSEVMTAPEVIAARTTIWPSSGGGLHEHQSHGAPVVEDGKLVGIITISDIARSDASGTGGRVGQAMTPRPATVTPTTRVSRALERMAALGVGRLPVVDADHPEQLVAMFRREDAVKAYHKALTAATDVELHRARLAQHERRSRVLRLQDSAGFRRRSHLSKPQTMISPKETFRRAVELVAVHGPLLVVDDERGLLGVLSDATLLRGLLPAYIQAQDLLAGVLDERSAEALFTKAQERKVGDLLTGDIPLVKGEDSLIEVAAMMVRSGSPLIAVLEEGRIIGGITLHDLLAQLTR